jgi:FkbM family methyltransferase
MAIINRKASIPDYIYGGRIGEDLLLAFECEYFDRVEKYSDGLMAQENAKEMAKRIGYVFMKEISDKIERWQKKGQHKSITDMVELGEKGFAWRFSEMALNKYSNILCFGLGSNMTFEGELAKYLNATVHCFDPTEQALKLSERYIGDRTDLILYPWGISDKDEIIKFYLNTVPGMGSLSIENLSYGEYYVEAQVYSLKTICEKVGMDKVDFLKIDVEGAEYGVIDDLAKQEIEVDQFALEFDQPMPPWRTMAAFEKLYSVGYYPVSNWGLNWLFIHERIL